MLLFLPLTEDSQRTMFETWVSCVGVYALVSRSDITQSDTVIVCGGDGMVSEVSLLQIIVVC